jgi:ferredoxin
MTIDVNSMAHDTTTFAAARAAASEAAKRIRVVPPEAVSFASRGTVLLTGRAERALGVLNLLPAPLRVVAFVPGAPDDMAVGPNLRLVAAPITSLSGHLGHFSATSVPVNGEPVDAARFGWNEDRHFDLVLDLNEPPLLKHEVRPLGYYAPRDETELASAVEAIRAQPGVSHKLRYFAYDAGRCTHGAASLTGCTRCLDACPAGAVASAGAKVQFDPFLCQGCGTCTTVCPDGAVRYAYPPAATTLETVRVMLEAWRATGAASPRLVVVTEEGASSETAQSLSAAPDALSYPVHALASFGIEGWFAALAWGAAQVVLAAGANTPQASLRALHDEIAVAHAVLTDLGEPPSRIVLIEGVQTLPRAPTTSIGNSAGPRTLGSKRSTLYAALDYLAENKTVSDVPMRLPDGASIGAVEVSEERCTLCFACVNLCPTYALSNGSDAQPELRFTESRCVQCGLCERGCPERAIQLIPQITLARAVREKSRVLFADESFKCLRCGTPFISRRTLMRSMELVKEHPLIQQEGIERLKLCMPCRADATMREAMPDQR